MSRRLLVLVPALLLAFSTADVRAWQPDDAPPEKPVESKPESKPAGKSQGEPLTKPGELPWEKETSKAPVLPIKRLESARELLNAYSIDESQLANFLHHQPLGPGEEETLYRILFRLPYFGLANVDRWTKKEVSWSEVAAQPDQHRAELFEVRGRATRVERREVLKEVADVLEYDHYFQVTLVLDGAPNPVLVCARHVPENWPLDAPLDAPTACAGLFLKLGPAAEEGPPSLVFAALRMEWHPTQADKSLGVTPDQAWLAGHGFDVGLFDPVRARNQKPIGKEEGECFYELLSTLGRIAPADLKARAKHALDLGPLLQDAKQHHADVVLVRGNAQRVQKIVLGSEDRDFRERYGVEHYYQVDVFIPLGDKQVQFSKTPQDKGGPIFVNSFLVTLCVLKVPPEMEEGQKLDLEVRLPAVFYKIWEFPSDYVKKFGDGQWKMQPAPMLLGIEPEILVREKPTSSPFFNAGLTLVAIVALVGVVFGLWQFGKGDKEFQKKARDIAPKPKIDAPK